ncbi:hypothetical protein ACFL5A_00635 [Gemmatimonadota bacterium]
MKWILNLLEDCREREKRQAEFYRTLAVEAEGRGDLAASERLNALLADEQHHLSRVTARLLELGGAPRDLPAPLEEGLTLEAWEEEARNREREEVVWYEGLLTESVDDTTRGLLQEILESEIHHARELGGKWMSA